MNAEQTQKQEYNIDSLLNKPFFNNHLSEAFKQAANYANQTGGFIANMPELISMKSRANPAHAAGIRFYTAHTEENYCIDRNGLFYAKGTPVLVVMNGGGIITPEVSKDGELINGNVIYNEDEVEALLEGRIPNVRFPMYNLEKVLEGVSKPHQFGVVMPFELAKRTKSGIHSKKEFMENPLVIARNAGLENLEAFYDTSETHINGVYNTHSLAGIKPSHPQGRMLAMGPATKRGLIGHYLLDGNGHFLVIRNELNWQ